MKSPQIVFQNPDSALNRSHSVRRMIGRTIGRLAGTAGAARDKRIRELADSVRLSERYLSSRPPSSVYGGAALRGSFDRRGHAGRVTLSGEIPSAAWPPGGCVFHARCHRKIGAVCEERAPPLTVLASGHLVRCHLPPGGLPRQGA